MKKYIIFSLIALTTLCISCDVEDKYYGKVVDPDPESYLKTPYAINWRAAADSASFEFVKQFYSTRPNEYSYNGVFTYSQYDQLGGNSNNYWQQAHAMNVMIDFYNRIKEGQTSSVVEFMNADPNVSLPSDTPAAIKSYRTRDQITETTLRNYFTQWYEKKGNNYEGNANYRGPAGFGNDFTDDTSWIVQTLTQLYDATGEQKYYDAAKLTYDNVILPRWDDVNGGYPWKMTNPAKNECTNGPVCINECRFALYAKVAGNEADYQKYLTLAIRTFEFLSTSLFNAKTGQVGATSLSYTQATFMESGRLLYQMTGDKRYLRDAIFAARFQMTNPSMINAGLMRDEGIDENNSIFKGVFFHYAKNFILDANFDLVDSNIRAQMKRFITYHANCAWTLNIDKSKWPNCYFGVHYKTPRSIYGGSQGAQTSACNVIEVMTQVEHVKL